MKYIKNFDESLRKYFSKIEEAYDNPVEIDWILNDNNSLIGVFKINNNLYKIACINEGNNIWSYKFYYNDGDNDKTELTGFKKDSFKVLPTITIGLENLIVTKKPDAVIYAAFDSSHGRKKLYDSFSNNFSKKYEFRYKTYQFADKQVYILYKNNIDRHLLISKVEEMGNQLF